MKSYAIKVFFEWILVLCLADIFEKLLDRVINSFVGWLVYSGGLNALPVSKVTRLEYFLS